MLALNEHGTPVTFHTCQDCGNEFTVCPAVPGNKHDQWVRCLAWECPSYVVMRDVEFVMGLPEAGIARDDD